MDVRTGASLVATTGFILDQLIKATLTGTTTIAGVMFRRVANTGVSFGFFQGYNAFFIPVVAAVLVGVWSLRDELGVWPTALILSGGVSNFVDRIVYGHVVDYVDIGFWPVFNVADAMIVVGIAAVIMGELRIDGEERSENNG
jgi:signal peptidase II